MDSKVLSSRSSQRNSKLPWAIVQPKPDANDRSKLAGIHTT